MVTKDSPVQELGIKMHSLLVYNFAEVLRGAEGLCNGSRECCFMRSWFCSWSLTPQLLIFHFSLDSWAVPLCFFFYVKNGLCFQGSSFSTCYWPIERPRSILGSRLIPCVFHLLSFINTNLKNFRNYCVRPDHGPSYSTEETTTAVLFEIGLSSPQPFHASVENVMKIFRIAFVWLDGSQWRCFCALGDIWKCLQTFFGYYS